MRFLIQFELELHPQKILCGVNHSFILRILLSSLFSILLFVIVILFLVKGLIVSIFIPLIILSSTLITSSITMTMTLVAIMYLTFSLTIILNKVSQSSRAYDIFDYVSNSAFFDGGTNILIILTPFSWLYVSLSR